MRGPMITVSEGANKVQIDGIVAEAIDQLGYFHPASRDLIAARIARLWGNNAYTFENDGDRIRPLPDRPRYQVAGEIWGCLSEKGRADPSYACKATLLRVTFNVYRARDAANRKLHRQFASRVRFGGVGDYTCSVARPLNGHVMPLTRSILGLRREVSLPELPLQGCTADWCACRWNFLPDD
jgi:hypothetical protein